MIPCHFERTSHHDIDIGMGSLETCVLLVHNKSTEHFTVEYSPEDSGYMEKLPPNATYREIQEWIARNYNGMKVSNLYIAQVKQKHGIIERENYNKTIVPHSYMCDVSLCTCQKACLPASCQHADNREPDSQRPTARILFP